VRRRRTDDNTREIAAAGLANFATWSASPPRPWPGAIEAILQFVRRQQRGGGITTTPSLIDASMVSHNGTTLPSSSNR